MAGRLVVWCVSAVPQMAGLGHAQAGVLRARAQPGPASFCPLRLMQGIGTEARQDRFDDRGVIEQGVRCGGFDPRRDDDRWHAHAVAGEHLGLIVGGVGRRDVIVEAAVFVVDDLQQRAIPLRACGQRVIDGENEVLAVFDVGRGMVDVRRGGRAG